jgi:hypothetical protein
MLGEILQQFIAGPIAEGHLAGFPIHQRDQSNDISTVTVLQIEIHSPLLSPIVHKFSYPALFGLFFGLEDETMLEEKCKVLECQGMDGITGWRVVIH